MDEKAKYTELESRTELLYPAYRHTITDASINIAFGNRVGKKANVYSQKHTDDDGNNLISLSCPNGRKFAIAEGLELGRV